MAPFLRDTLLATSVMGGWIFTSAVILPACGLESCTTGRCVPVPRPHNNVQQLSPTASSEPRLLTVAASETQAASEEVSVSQQSVDKN